MTHDNSLYIRNCFIGLACLSHIIGTFTFEFARDIEQALTSGKEPANTHTMYM